MHGRLVVAGFWRALWSAPGKRDTKNSASVRGAFQHNLATMILHNLLYDCKSKPGAVLFAEAYKGMKQLVTNRLGNAGAVIGDGDGYRGTGAVDGNQNSAFAAGRGLTGIQQQIVESALQLAGIEPCQSLAVAANFNQSALMTRVQAHRLHGALDSFADTGVGWAQRFPGAG